MALHELIYTSLATREMSPSDLTGILDQAREKNARRNITGLLVYYRQTFMQSLEGDKAEIFSLFDTISQDTRATKSYLMWDAPIEQRSFPSWSMAFLAPGDLSLEENPAYSNFLATGFGQEVPGSRNTLGKQFLMSLRNDFLNRG